MSSVDLAPDEEFYFKFIEQHCPMKPISNENDFEDEYNSVDPHVRNVILANYMIGCLMNGGLKQFFYREVSISAPELSLALGDMNELEMKSLIDSVLMKIGEPYPRNRNQRELILDRINKHSDELFLFDSIDSKLYQIVGENCADFISRQCAYIRNNISWEKSGVNK